MANTTSVGFKKYTSKPTADSSISKGDIVFVTGEKTIYVATDDTVASLVPFYGGEVKNVTFTKKKSTDTEPSQLTFTFMDGTHLTLDFSDIASISNVDDLISALETSLTTRITTAQQKADSAFSTATSAYSIAAANKTTLQNLTPGLIKEDDQTKGTVYYLTLTSNEATPVVSKKIDITTVVNDFIKDSFLDGTTLITATATSQKVTINGTSYTVTGLTVGQTYIVFAWISQDGKAAQALNVTTLIDTYTAGDGLTLSNNKFSVKAVVPIVTGTSGVQLKYNDTLVTDTDNALGVNQTGVESWIDAKINALDANPTGSSSQGIKVQVTQTDGKVSSVSVSQSQSFVTDVLSGDAGTLTVTKSNNVVTVTPRTVGVSNTTAVDGLAMAGDVKSYVDTHIASAFTWTVFE